MPVQPVFTNAFVSASRIIVLGYARKLFEFNSKTTANIAKVIDMFDTRSFRANPELIILSELVLIGASARFLIMLVHTVLKPGFIRRRVCEFICVGGTCLAYTYICSATEPYWYRFA